jgi:hypothetical protein
LRNVDLEVEFSGLDDIPTILSDFLKPTKYNRHGKTAGGL